MPPRKGREDRGASRKPSDATVPSSAILDAAFHKAHKATPHGDTHLDRSRLRAKLKIVRSGAVAIRQLRLATRPFLRPGPTDFEKLLVAKAFGPGTLERALRRLQRAESRIRGLSVEEQRRLRRASSTDAFGESVIRFYGRLASFLREVDPDLVQLRAIGRHLKERPHLTDSEPVVVVAGFPNVGKSSLVARLSSARPKVSDYPFTTLALQVGHADLGFDRLQVLDTPGVLGRRDRENSAEVEAETAVERAATLVVFVLDPSERCGYPMAEQERLLERWRAELPNIPILEIETKSDLLRSQRSGRLAVSATTGEGLEELRAELQRRLASWRPPASAAPPAVEEGPYVIDIPDEGPDRAAK